MFCGLDLKHTLLDLLHELLISFPLPDKISLSSLKAASEGLLKNAACRVSLLSHPSLGHLQEPVSLSSSSPSHETLQSSRA